MPRQLSHQGGTALAASYDALSADHVEYATEADAPRQWLKFGHRGGDPAGCVLHAARKATAANRRLPRAWALPMALSTDCNPGSSPLTSILLAMNMGCTLFRLTPAEALRGVTVNAARALGLDDCGRIAPGFARRSRGLGRG